MDGRTNVKSRSGAFVNWLLESVWLVRSIAPFEYLISIPLLQWDPGDLIESSNYWSSSSNVKVLCCVEPRMSNTRTMMKLHRNSVFAFLLQSPVIPRNFFHLFRENYEPWRWWCRMSVLSTSTVMSKLNVRITPQCPVSEDEEELSNATFSLFIVLLANNFRCSRH